MSRKYTPEQIEAEITRPRKCAGRPRKYATEEERKRAKADSRVRAYWRQKSAMLDVEIGEAIARRTQAHTTDEERRIAQNRRVSQYRQNNPEKIRLVSMVHYYTTREP